MALYKNDVVKLPEWENIPNELKIIDHWLAWKTAPEVDNANKLKKIPIGKNGNILKGWNDLGNLFSYEEAKQVVESGKACGVMFAPKDTHLTVIDLDNDKSIEAISDELLDYTKLSYTEVSPSGRGVHVWLKAFVPEDAGNKRKTETGETIELFSNSKLITVTGHRYNELPVKNDQLSINKLVEKYKFKSPKKSLVDIEGGTSNLRMEQVFEIMERSKNFDKIKALFHGDTSQYAGDQSSADLALCNQLAFFCQKDPELMDECFRQSLLMRDKWDKKHKSDGSTYGQITIQTAIENCKNIYQPKERFSVIIKDEEQKKTSFGTTPYHIGKAIQTVKNAPKDKIDDLLHELNETTPKWFKCGIEYSEDGSSFYLTPYFDHEKMGDMVIQQNELLRIPKLLEGALYEPQKGAWRYFGKNEMIMFSEKVSLEELQNWGFYEAKYISQVSRYVKQKTYNPTFSNSNPFEDSAPELVVFKNGTYNILTDTMKQHDPKDYILTSFDYELDTSGKATPNSDNFFNAFFGESALFMKQYIGYMFYRSYAPAPDMVFLYGPGGEGKSSFLTMVRDYYIKSVNTSSLTPEQIAGERFSIVDLLGKCANICGDIDAGFLLATAILKRITGGDSVKGEFKGIQGFDFISYAKLFFSMNEFFHFKDMSTGFESRLTVVPITIGDQRQPNATFWDSHDTDLIKEEAPAFVYACMREFRKVFNGKKVNFTKSKSMEQAKNEWLFDNDRIAQFLFEATEIVPNDDRGEIGSTVYKEYKAFCYFNGFTPKSAKELTSQLKKKGIEKKKSTRGFNDGGSRLDRYIGLRLTSSFSIETYN